MSSMPLPVHKFIQTTTEAWRSHHFALLPLQSAVFSHAAEDEDKPKPKPLDKDGEDNSNPKGSGGNETDVSSIESSSASVIVGAYYAMSPIGVALLPTVYYSRFVNYSKAVTFCAKESASAPNALATDRSWLLIANAVREHGVCLCIFILLSQ